MAVMGSLLGHATGVCIKVCSDEIRAARIHCCPRAEGGKELTEYRSRTHCMYGCDAALLRLEVRNESQGKRPPLC
jgi:hypothetical protein